MPPTEAGAKVNVLVTVPFSDEELHVLREVSPRLKIHHLPVRDVRVVPSDVFSRTEILYTDRLLPNPEQVPELRWLQFHFAGIDFAVDDPLLKKQGLLVTTLSGAAAPQIAEYGLGLLLALGHRLPEISAHQSRAEWPRDRWERFRPVEIRGSTVAIIGYGSVGRELARLLHTLGVKILAVKRDVFHPQDTGYRLPGLGDAEGDLFHRLYPFQAIRSVLASSDFVVVCTPLTPETRGMIGAAELAAMQPSAFLVSLGRGGVVDQDALIAALQERRIAGAALDVFSEEPLPPSSPLWKIPNTILSPHIGGMSPLYNRRAVDLFAENLRLYLAGEQPYNRFDPQRGY